jgi:hypothetical protein
MLLQVPVAACGIAVIIQPPHFAYDQKSEEYYLQGKPEQLIAYLVVNAPNLAPFGFHYWRRRQAECGTFVLTDSNTTIYRSMPIGVSHLLQTIIHGPSFDSPRLKHKVVTLSTSEKTYLVRMGNISRIDELS